MHRLSCGDVLRRRLCGRPASAAVPEQKTTSAAGASVPAGVGKAAVPASATGAAVPAGVGKAAVPASATGAAVPAGVGKAAVPASATGAAVPAGVGKAAVPAVPASAAGPAKGGRARRANGDRAGRVGEDPDGTGGDQHAVGVADRVDVEADEVALVVDAVDGGGAGAARVRNCGEPERGWSR